MVLANTESVIGLGAFSTVWSVVVGLSCVLEFTACLLCAGDHCISKAVLLTAYIPQSPHQILVKARVQRAFAISGDPHPLGLPCVLEFVFLPMRVVDRLARDAVFQP
jgi:hypothetical protein